MDVNQDAVDISEVSDGNDIVDVGIDGDDIVVGNVEDDIVVDNVEDDDRPEPQQNSRYALLNFRYSMLMRRNSVYKRWNLVEFCFKTYRIGICHMLLGSNFCSECCFIVHFRINDAIQSLINAVEDYDEGEEVDIKLLQQLLELLGTKFVQKDIYEDGLCLKSKYKEHGYLSKLDSKVYLTQRNQLLLSFINGCCAYQWEEQNKSLTLFTISVAVEMIYFLRNMNLVLPHCFLLNLLQSFVSGSKTVSALNGMISPGASYTTYRNWIEYHGCDELLCPPRDTITYFDNIGKYVIKSYQVSTQKYKKADIITATLHFKLDGQLQKRTDLKPSNWPKKDVKSKHLEMRKLIESSNNTFFDKSVYVTSMKF